MNTVFEDLSLRERFLYRAYVDSSQFNGLLDLLEPFRDSKEEPLVLTEIGLGPMT